MLDLHSVLLDTQRPGPGETAGALLFSRPRTVLEARSAADLPAVLDGLDAAARGGRWAAGFLAYEAGYALLDGLGAPPSEGGDLLAWFGVYDEPDRLAPDELAARLAEAGTATVSNPRFGLDFAAYRERVEAVRALIREGDVYQINLTAPMRFGFAGDALGLFRDLRRKQRVAYGAAIRLEDRTILSLSPELFVRRDGDRLTARPMKGTVRRGSAPTDDAERAAWLTADAKNRAENLMIVDLLRNDLSVVAEPGSVRVPAAFEAERYDTLWQMTSTVTAEAQPDTGVADVVRALFPCGSVTGAPKHRAMQRIRALEDGPRGVYCGAIGVVKPGGDFAFNVPIRTLDLRAERGVMGVGSGLVWDSDPESEYAECLLKARFLTDPPLPDFCLLETMRAEGGSVPRLDLHLARLAASADYFGFAYDESAVREAVGEAARQESGAARLRLTLDRLGRPHVEAAPLDDRAIRTAVIYPEPVSLDDPFLRHKTTHRPFYDAALGFAREAGADEAILIDTEGFVTEGTFTNVWIERDGRLLTPPLTRSGLAGVERARRLATDPRAAEVPLRPDEMLRAEAVYLSNALRGFVRVTMRGALS